MLIERRLFQLAIFAVVLTCIPFVAGYSQEVVRALSFQFDENDQGSILSIINNNLDDMGFMGIRDGAFEIRDMEGNQCVAPFSPTNGFNDNLALLMSGVATQAYCNVSIILDMSLSNAPFESCASPGSMSPVGCSDFQTTGPGGDGINVQISINGGTTVLSGGYCGSTPEGRFDVTGLTLDIGDFLLINIIGGTQAPDEAYFIDAITVVGTPKPPVDPMIEASETRYCEGEPLILTEISGGAGYRWFKDNQFIQNGGASYVIPQLSTADVGQYSVQVTYAEGCTEFAFFDLIAIEDCPPEVPEFSLPDTLCASDILELPETSENGVNGTWNINNQSLEGFMDYVDLVFTPQGNATIYEDSIYVAPIFELFLFAPLCPEDSLVINGTTYDFDRQSGTEIMTAATGCDSIIYVQIDPLTSYTMEVVEQYCEGDTVALYDSLYTEDVTHDLIYLTAENGCDSIIDLTLTFVEGYERIRRDTFCFDDRPVIDGREYSIDEPFYSETLSTVTGCDSVETVDLHFIVPDTIYRQEVFCAGEVRIIEGELIDSSLSGIIFFRGPNGCDSLIQYEFIHLDEIVEIRDDTLCMGGSVEINGSIYDADRPTGMEVLLSSGGCDSIIEVSLSFMEPDTVRLMPEICEGDSILINGIRYDQSRPSGIEIITLPNGCDSIVSIDVVILEPDTTTLDTILCNGDFILVNGTMYGENNLTGTEVISGSDGCDSVIIIALSILPEVTRFVNDEICQTDTVGLLINGFRYGVNNPLGIETIPGRGGDCDTIVEVDLRIVQTVRDTIQEDRCADDGYSITVGSETFDESRPVGEVTISSSNGCDSIVTIDLDFMVWTTDTLSYEGCQGDGYEIEVRGEIFDESRPSGIVMLEGDRCDDMLVVLLSFSPVYRDTIDYLGCQGDGYSVMIEGTIYDESEPTGVEMLSSDDGCDSLVVVSLEFLETDTSYLNTQYCQGSGSTITINGIIYDEANPVGEELLLNAAGCDSLVIIDLIYEEELLTIFNDTLCAGESIFIDGVRYDMTNPTGTAMYQTAGGCDSTVMIDLSFRPELEVALSQEAIADGYQIQLSADREIVMVSWEDDVALTCMDCLDPMILSQEPAIYRATVTDIHGCSAVVSVAINNPAVEYQVYIPNAFNPLSSVGNDRLRPVFDTATIGTYRMQVYDRWGNKIYQEDSNINDESTGWSGMIRGQIAQPGVYIYTLEIQIAGIQDPIIEHGSVTLLY